jgi:hypothetical protein
MVPKPARIHLIKSLESYENRSFLSLNNGILDKIIICANRFYRPLKHQWDMKNQIIYVNYQYEKPSCLYKNKVITSMGNVFQYQSSLLLPTISDEVPRNEAIMMGSSLNKKFSIKLIETIQWQDHQWTMTMRNGQIWYCGYNWVKFMKNIHRIPKVTIKKVINGNYEKVFVIKNNLLLKKNKKAVNTQDIKEKVSSPTAKDIKEKVSSPSTKDIKEKVSSPSTKDIKEKAPTTQDIKEKAPTTQDIKEKAPTTQDIKEKAPTTQDIKEKVSSPTAKDVKEKTSNPQDIKN